MKKYINAVDNLEEKLLEVGGNLYKLSRLENVTINRIRTQIKKESIDLEKIRADWDILHPKKEKEVPQEANFKLKWSTPWVSNRIEDI